MCIIAYAKSGVQIKERVIKTMFAANPDGAGIMWKPKEGGSVQIHKGFMNVADLLKAWAEIPVESDKAIHCRIATSGKISAACCHPFPVRPKTSMMTKASDKCYMALMHNGVIHQCTPTKGMKANYSDSMLFAAKYLYPLQKQIDKECVQDLLEDFSNSRLLIMRENGDTIKLGRWIESDGVYYSNDSFEDVGWGYYGKWHKNAPNSGFSYSWIVLDIGKDEPARAFTEIYDALKAANIVFDFMDDSTDGEISFEAYNFPDNITNIAGYDIVDRVDEDMDKGFCSCYGY